MAQIAARARRHEDFWPAWGQACAVGRGIVPDRAWGAAFLAALEELGRAPIGIDATTAVLVHAAIPMSSLDGVMRRLAAGEALSGLDGAVDALLRHGGAAGRDLFDRCLALIRFYRDGSDDPEPGSEAERLAHRGLGRRYADAARRAALTTAASDADDVLRLEPYGLGVLCGSAESGDGHGHAEPVGPAQAVDPSDPLLLFAEDGTALGGVLPPDAVWALYPADRPFRADRPPRVLVESRMPLSWHGWRLTQLDLDAVSWIESGGSDAVRHTVRGRTRPRLILGPPVAGATTASGMVVHSSLPTVHLPTARAERWRVEVRRAADGQVLAAVEATTPTWKPESLWARVPRPVLGEFVLSATAAAGRDEHSPGLRRAIAVAEGLEVRYAPEPRLTDARTLEAGEAVILAPAGMTAWPAALSLGPGVVSAQARCVAGPQTLGLVLAPPHMRVLIETGSAGGAAPAAWQCRPLRLAFSDLERGGALRLDLPRVERLPPMEVMAARERVQVVEPSRRGRYPLRRLLDTVAARGAVELRVAVNGRSAVVARVDSPNGGADPWLTSLHDGDAARANEP